MFQTDTLCLNCMADKGNESICFHCGFDERQSKKSSIALPFRTVLNDRFVVGRILGQPGGFGITYLAWDIVLETAVAIKEFMPLSAVSRVPGASTIQANSEQDEPFFNKGLNIFLNEAKTLAQFSHPNIVRIKDFFRANNTAYLIMEYHQGVPLDEYIKDRGGRLTEDQALSIMMPILDGVKAIHQHNFLHRDIKPKNIYMSNKGMPILLDFGAARLSMLDTTHTLTVMLSRGFAPFEQYHEKGAQGPWSDIYACGATMYYMVTGKVPTDAIERRHSDQLPAPIQLNPSLRESFNLAIIKAMAVNPSARPQDVEQFKQMLLGASYRHTITPDLAMQPTITGFQVSESFPPKADPSRLAAKNRQTVAHKRNLPSDNGFSFGKLAVFAIIGIAVFFGWSKQPPKTEQVQNNAQSTQESVPAPAPKIETSKQEVKEVLVPKAPESQPEVAQTQTKAIVLVPEKPKISIDENYGKTHVSSQPKPEPIPEPKFETNPPVSISGQPLPIPQIAYDVCAQLSINSECGFQTPRGLEEGKCLRVHAGRLACIPKFAPLPPSPY